MTAVDLYGNWSGDFWIQQPGGGLQSGIHVFGAPNEQVRLLSVGDVVNLSGGRKSFYAAASDDTGRREIEITPTLLGEISIVPTGTTMAPIVMVIDPASLKNLSQAHFDEARDALAGALVRIGHQRAESEPLQGPEPTLFRFSIGPFDVQSSVSEFPPGIMTDTCFESLQGVIEYRLEYNLNPRTMQDVNFGSSCP